MTRREDFLFKFFILLLIGFAGWICGGDASATTRSEALAACKASAGKPESAGRHMDCNTENADGSGHMRFVLQGDSHWNNVAGVWEPPKIVYSYYYWEVDDRPPPDDSACSVSTPDVIGSWEGKILTGSHICVSTVTPTSNGVEVSCRKDLSNTGAPYFDPQAGKWYTRAKSSNAGRLCADGELSDGTVYGPGGSPAPAPKGPPIPTPAPDSPRVCGGGSCYDPNTDRYCAVSGGEQICVPGSAGRGASGGGSGSGSCASGSSATVCSGPSPAGAPSPPAPPASPISDPVSEISSSDNTAQANPVSGANVTVNTTVYTSPGNAVSNGAKPGDSTPPKPPSCITDADGTKKCAPAGDPGDAYCVTLADGTTKCVSKDNKGEASGGQTCDSPPVCSGDQPTCMVVTQTWLHRCRPTFGQDEKGQPKWTKVSASDGDGYATTDTPRSAVVDDGTGSGGVGGGVGDIDQSGWAGNTCPALPSFEVFGQIVSFDQTLFCNWLAIIRTVILLVAGFVSARIIASGGKS